MGKAVIKLTETALADLEDIELYISHDSPALARRFISRIFDKIEQLSEYPESGKPVPEIKDNSLRELLLNRYRIIYQITNNDKIDIVRIVHGSRILDIDF